MKLAEGGSNDDKQLVFPFMIGAPRPAATPVTDEVKRIIFVMRSRGYIQSDIAAAIGTNQGRVL